MSTWPDKVSFADQLRHAEQHGDPEAVKLAAAMIRADMLSAAKRGSRSIAVWHPHDGGDYRSVLAAIEIIRGDVPSLKLFSVCGALFLEWTL